MAGSGVAWHVLVLELIARFAGPQEAMQVARINLMELNATSPVAYASLTHGAQSSDPLISRCQQWAAMNYQVESPVTQMVALSGLPERTFKRRFMQVTGMSPLEYVHMLRLEEAKQMLEAGDEPIEAIAAEVGYQRRELLQPAVPAQGAAVAGAVPAPLQAARREAARGCAADSMTAAAQLQRSGGRRGRRP